MDLSSETGNNELLYKILVVGDIGVGKTSLIKRYVHGIFSIHYKSTIGVDFALKVIHWNDNTNIRLQLWDIAGQERFSNMTRVYYKEAVGAFVVYDITRQNTFEAVKKWKSDLDNKVKLNGGDECIPVVLLANKIDLINSSDDEDGYERWEDTKKDLDKYCEENGFIGWFETSAKDNINLEKASSKLISEILEKTKEDLETRTVPESNLSPNPNIIKLKENDTREYAENCC